MIENITKTVTSVVLYLSLLLFGPNIYAADPPFTNQSVVQANNDETSKYLRILLNHTFGINPDANNIPPIQDPNRDEGNSNNMLKGLIFLNPSDNSYIFCTTKKQQHKPKRQCPMVV